MGIRAVAVAVHNVVPAGPRNILIRAQVDPRTGPDLHTPLHTQTTSIIQCNMNTIAQRDKFFAPGAGSEIHPPADRNLGWIGKCAGDLHIVIHPVETEHLASCSIRHNGRAVSQRPVLRRAGSHVIGIAFEGIAGLEIGIDIERHKGVVTRRNRECRAAVEVGCRRIDQAVERSINIRDRTAERHGAVGGAVAGCEGEAGRAGQRCCAVGHRQGDLEACAAGVGIGDGNLIAVTGGKHQIRVFVGTLRPRYGIERRIVDGRDTHRHATRSSEGSTRALAAAVPVVERPANLH